MCSQNIMDKYSNLVKYFSKVTGSQDPEPYSNFVKELSIFEEPHEELCKLIKTDLKTILPALLTLSIGDNVNIRCAVSKTFPTFCKILKTYSSVKKETWWKDMEDKLIAVQYSSRLLTMVEKNEEPWPRNWVFVMTLIVADCDHMRSIAINSLLKVVETAFKISKKNPQTMESAYFCWNELIDIFSKHPRLCGSQKLLDLFVRPLSTSNLSLQCPQIKMKTWQNLLKKIGYISGSRCKSIIEPFLESMFLKEADSFCATCPGECLDSYREILEQRKLFKYFSLKAAQVFAVAAQNIKDDDKLEVTLNIWTKLVENMPEVNMDNLNDYNLCLLTKFIEIFDPEKEDIMKKMLSQLLGKNIFTLENLQIITQADHAWAPVFALALTEENFLKTELPPLVQKLCDHLSESSAKQISKNNVDLRIWDSICEAFTLWLKACNPHDLNLAEFEPLGTLLMVPFTFKQWSVVAVQKVWLGLVDGLLAVGGEAASSVFLGQLFSRLVSALQQQDLSVSTCFEICSHVVGQDKSAYRLVMPALSAASRLVLPKEPKPLLDILVLLENSVNHVPKAELSKFINEILADVIKYEHPWGLRIKTKCSKVLRKLMMMKEGEEADAKSPSTHSTLGDGSERRSAANKMRSPPAIARSCFLQRLAKAEEKKKKSIPTHSSVFGDTASPSSKAPEVNGELEEVKQEETAASKSGSDASTEGTDALRAQPPAAKTDETTVTVQPAELPAEGRLPSDPLTAKSAACNSTAESDRLSPTPTNACTVQNPASTLATCSSPATAKSTKLAACSSPVSGRLSPSLSHPSSLQTPGSSLAVPTRSAAAQSAELVSTPKSTAKSGRKSPSIPPSVTIVTSAKSPRSRSKSPEVVLAAKQRRLTLPSPKTPLPPAYFDESAQETYVIVPPKPKSTPLTEHQKEMLTKRRTDIPALYQDLSQDTQSQSVSLKEIVQTNFAKSPVEQPAQNVDDLKLVDGSFTLPKIGDQTLAVLNESNISMVEATEEFPKNDSAHLSVDMFSSSGGNTVHETIKSPVKTSPGAVESLDIIEKNPVTVENVVAPLSVTPTKQHGPPTPKNLSQILLLTEGGDEEEEIGKENINDRKTVKVFTKRLKRTVNSRKGCVIKNDDLPEGKLKPLNETTEIPQIIVSGPETHVNTANIEPTFKKDIIQTEKVSSSVEIVNAPILTSTKVADAQNEDENGKMSDNAVKTATSKSINSTDASKTENQLDDTFKLPEGNESLNESKDNVSGVVESSESLSGESWTMTSSTPRPTKRRVKKKTENTTQFSPKQLRSKRLSLTKNKESSVVPTKKSRKSESNISKKNPAQELVETTNDDTSKKCDPVVEMNSENTTEITDETSKNLTPSGRKRRMTLAGDEVVEKKAKNDEKDQESLPVNKGSLPTKLTKKKVAKSNVKVSPYNLEQWLLKGDKTVAKNTGEPVSPSVVLSSSPSKNPIVTSSFKEMSHSPSKSSNNDFPSPVCNMEVEIVVDSQEPPKNSSVPEEDELTELHNCTLIGDSGVLGNSFSEEIPPTQIVEPSSVPDDNLQVKESVSLEEEQNLSPVKLSESPKERLLIPEIRVQMAESPKKKIDVLLPASPVKRLDSLSVSSSLGGSEEALIAGSSPTKEGDGSPQTVGSPNTMMRIKMLRRQTETPAREMAPGPDHQDEDGAKSSSASSRGLRSGRSRQILSMMARSEEEPIAPLTPIRKRASIQPFHKTDNWPEGRMETWVPCLPTPPGVTLSPGSILKKRTTRLSPISSPTASPQTRKKRVSFLDPVVYSGLMYAKECSEPLGEVQYASITLGEKPPRLDRRDTTVEEATETGPQTADPAISSSVEPDRRTADEAETGGATDPSTSPRGTADEAAAAGGGGASEMPEEGSGSAAPASSSRQQLSAAIQDFLQSTPDAPWNHRPSPSKAPLSSASLQDIQLSSIEDLSSRPEPIEELLKTILSSQEDLKIAVNIMKKFNVHRIADLGSVNVTRLAHVCDKYLKSKPLSGIIENQIMERNTRLRSRKSLGSVLFESQEAEKAKNSPLCPLMELQNFPLEPKKLHSFAKPTTDSADEVDSSNKVFARKKGGKKKLSVTYKTEDAKRNLGKSENIVQAKKTTSKRSLKTGLESLSSSLWSLNPREASSASSRVDIEKVQRELEKTEEDFISGVDDEDIFFNTLHEKSTEKSQREVSSSRHKYEVALEKKGTQTSVHVEPDSQNYPEKLDCTQHFCKLLNDRSFQDLHLPKFLQNHPEFSASCVKNIINLPESQIEDIIKGPLTNLFEDLASKNGWRSVSLLIDILQSMKRKISSKQT